MAHYPEPAYRPRMTVFEFLVYAATIVMVVIMIATYIGYNPFRAPGAIAPAPEPAVVVRPAQPASAPRVNPAPRPADAAPAQPAPVAAPDGSRSGVYDTPAEADAAYQEAIRQAELNAAPLPNGSKSTNEAPPNAPAYDPAVVEVQYEGIPNPGAGQCLHGQIYTDRGCKNPANGSKATK